MAKKKKNIAGTTAIQKQTQKNTSAKKAAVLGTDRTSRFPLLAGLVCAALLIGVTYYFIPKDNKETFSGAFQTSFDGEASTVTYPVSLFDDGTARHFAYKTNNIAVKYFVLKSSDGIIRAAFDACDVCWPAGKGYYQDGDDMVCRNCGRRFASTLINQVKGGCNPAPLKRKIVEGNLVIHFDDIAKGKQYFNFSGKV